MIKPEVQDFLAERASVFRVSPMFPRTLAVLLAGLLQLMPMLRAVLPVVTQGAAPSAWAIVLKLAGAAAVFGLGTHAVSGGSVYINGVGTPKSFTIKLTNGVAFTPIRLTTGGQTAQAWSTTTAPLNTAVYSLSPGLFLTNSTGFIGGKPAQAGTNTYTISAWELVGNSGATVSTNFTFEVMATATAPGVATPPANMTVVAGSNATFTVSASGTAPLGYQWRKNGLPIGGATGSNWVVGPCRAADSGSAISVVITNAGGSITSAVATLTVNNPPPPPPSPAPVPQAGKFLFTFTPVIGLTNTVLTNGTAGSTGWAVLTNVPPPATASSITVTDAAAAGTRFYRVMVVP